MMSERDREKWLEVMTADIISNEESDNDKNNRSQVAVAFKPCVYFFPQP